MVVRVSGRVGLVVGVVFESVVQINPDSATELAPATA
jgi:hypothetical protein